MDYTSVFNCLPTKIRSPMEKLSLNDQYGLEEIRIRCNCPIIMCIFGGEFFLSSTGKTSDIACSIVPNKDDCDTILENICEHSIYAKENQLKNGFITLNGGYRVGLGGQTVLSGQEVRTITNCSSFNIRFVKEVLDCSLTLLNYIKSETGIYNTLIISPPMMGKTTILRDVSRVISDGIHMQPKKVCIVDERSEIAGCYSGVPQLDVGIRTDVLDGCPKHLGIMMVLRSMSPQVIITDELGRQSDIDAVFEIINCGVSIITSVHGNSLDEILSRKIFETLLCNNVFQRYVILGNSLGVGTVEKIYDNNKKSLLPHPIRGE